MTLADIQEQELVSLLARIVNQSSHVHETPAAACPMAGLPLGLLQQARTLLRKYRDTELSTSEVRAACNKIW